MLYAFPSFNHLGALDICVVHWDLIPLERNPVNALIIDVTMVGNEEEVNLTDVPLVSDDDFWNLVHKLPKNFFTDVTMVSDDDFWN